MPVPGLRQPELTLTYEPEFRTSDSGLGELGTEPGDFSFPRRVAMDVVGRILVAEWLSYRVSNCEEQNAG